MTNGAARNLHQRENILSLLTFLFLGLVYLALWWNRYLGLTLEGWFQYYGHRIAQGALPYRDFYVFAPPFELLSAGLIDTVFNSSLVALRLFGAAERLAGCLLLYAWTRRLFGTRPALAVVVPTFFCFSADISDVLFYYQQDASVFALIGTLCLANAAGGGDSPSRRSALLAGIGLGLTLLTRQTVGIFLIAAAVALLVYLRVVGAIGARALGRIAVPLVAGAVLVIAPVAAWLAANHAWAPFVRQVFVEGPSSKGPILSVLARPILPLLPTRWGGALVPNWPSCFSRPAWSWSAGGRAMRRGPARFRRS